MTQSNSNAPIPGSPDYPLHSELTIGKYFQEQVAIDPNHDFIVYPDRQLRWTYQDFDQRTDNLAKGLLAIGMKPGDHLGVWARNIPDWLTFMFATAKVGIVLVTMNPAYKSHELDYVLKQSDMSTLCIIDAWRDVDYIKIIRELIPEAANCERGHLTTAEFPFLKNLVYMGPEKHRGFFTVPELLLLGSHMPDDALEEAKAAFDNNSVVNMQYTSGTTGFPKGVMLTHRNILNNGFFIGENQKLTAEDRVCLPVPFFHCFGCVLGVMAVLTHRSTMVVVEEFDTSQPTDPATGTPPLKSRTTTTTSSRTKEASAASKTTATAANRTSSEQTNTTAESEAAEREKKESAGAFCWLKIGAIIGLITALAVAALWKRFKNKLKP